VCNSLQCFEFGVIRCIRLSENTCNSLHIQCRQSVTNICVTKYLLPTGRWLPSLPRPARQSLREAEMCARDYFPPNTSLAMVANCMLDVPS